MNKKRGFTIVELLIVIVVVGILAAISIVAYGGVQNRARDTIRIDDSEKIRKALELYRIDTGEYPAAINTGLSNVDPNVPGSGWESSSYGGQSTWLDRIKLYTGKMPSLDPTNDTTHFYYYYFYKNNPGLCGVQTPNCYVFGISKLDAIDALQISGVDKSGGDSWRSTTTSTRAIWRGAY
ncbi:prepilin-type N-terminal cleavage/methylation domain-containing protein [Candidatus Saccharibacteria bacterium]|nr:prepilin-type N-terminal cleavage/methylation domain-containing protein [Candidatus Saccharibacteria bacterium]